MVATAKRKDLTKLTAIYTRLSRDDEQDIESNSISNQKKLLTRYVEEHGLGNYKIYVDDGVSGTTFERDGFKNMIADIEAEIVGTVVVKDMSRLGRDYLKVGFYTEIYFPEHDIHFIAVNDDVDSFKNDNDLTPFRNIMNEWYAKDCSKKIKSVFKNKGQSGERLCSRVPYGYLKNYETNQWEVDPATADNVRLIFDLFLQGNGVVRISKQLSEMNIPTPMEYMHSLGMYMSRNVSYSCCWEKTTIQKILTRQEYVGDTVNFKTKKVSYKSDKIVRVPKEEQLVFENTHEAIIDRDVFFKVQEIIATRRRASREDLHDYLAGYIFCYDCGKRLYLVDRAHRQMPYYFCRTYNQKNYTPNPDIQNHTMHYILRSVVHQAIVAKINALIEQVNYDYEHFLKMVIQEAEKKLGNGLLEKEKQKNDSRISELDNIIKTLFEQLASGNISEERFRILSSGYEAEQSKLIKRNAEIKSQIDFSYSQSKNIDRFIAVVKQYSHIDELTPEIVSAFIDKVLVHEAVKDENGTRTQEIDIYFNCIGKLD